MCGYQNVQFLLSALLSFLWFPSTLKCEILCFRCRVRVQLLRDQVKIVLKDDNVCVITLTVLGYKI